MKKVIAFAASLFVVVSSVFVFSVPSFAYTDTSLNGISFADAVIPFGDNTSYDTINASGFQYIESDNHVGFAVATHEDVPVYCFMYPQSQPDGNQYYICFCSDKTLSNLSSAMATRTYPNSNTQKSNIIYNYTDSVNNLRSFSTGQGMTTANNDFEIFVPIFPDAATGRAAVRDYIDNPTPPAPSVSPHPVNIELPAGYVAFVDIHGLTNIQGSVKAYSATAMTPHDWASTNKLYGYASSIPSSFNLPLNGSTSFSWNTGKTNVFGKSQNWSWLGTFAGGDNYLFFANPTFSPWSMTDESGNIIPSDNPSANNGYTNIYLAEAYSVKIISLAASYHYDSETGVYGDVVSDSGDQSYSMSYDDDTGLWITTDDSTDEPVGIEGLPVGGDNSIDVTTPINNIQAWLQNISNQISSFFNGAVGAVSTLVAAGHDFLAQLSGLYSWLPPPVYSVLCSALILVITIGVIKVFI